MINHRPCLTGEILDPSTGWKMFERGTFRQQTSTFNHDMQRPTTLASGFIVWAFAFKGKDKLRELATHDKSQQPDNSNNKS